MILPHSYTRALQCYDKDLFVEKTKDGPLCVFRKVKRYDEPIVVSEGVYIRPLITDKQFVFALTDNWTRTGVPRFWGIDDVVGRVRKLDIWENERFFDELDAENEKVDEIRRKDLRNEMEAFWSDQRERVKNATSDILTHSLSKDDKRKRLRDRSIKNGNH